MRLHRAAIVVMGMSVILACEEDKAASGGPGGGSVDGGAGPGTTPTAGSGGEFCQKTLGVVVGSLEACCTAEDKAAQDYTFTHGIAQAVLPICTSAIEASITKQRVLFHADQAASCYGAYATNYGPGKCANITQTFSDPAGSACRLTFSGVGAAGAACAGDHECVAGLTCIGFTDARDGTCKPPPAIGEECGPAPSEESSSSLSLAFGEHPACAAGARCDVGARKCVTAVALGAACTRNDDCESPNECVVGKCAREAGGENAPCAEASDCTAAFYCTASAETQGVCAKKKSAGGACTATSFVSECAGRCDGPAGEAGTCKSFCGSP